MRFTSIRLQSFPATFGFVIAFLSQGFAGGATGKEDTGSPDRSSGGPHRAHPLSMTLVWYDANRLLPRAFNKMAREVSGIFREVGVRITWQNGRERDAEGVDRDTAGVHVVLLPSSSTSWGFTKRVMGVATHSVGKSRSIYLFFPNIVRTLNLDKRHDELETPRAVMILALALGRVVAHELVHIVAPHHPHQGKGLMKPQLTRRSLTRRRVHLDPLSSRVFVAELRERVGLQPVETN